MAQAGSDLLPIEFLSISKTSRISALGSYFGHC